MAGYSRLIGADEERTLNRIRSIRSEVIDPKIAEHRGRIVKTTGDGLLVEFSSVVDALRFATEWQRGMAERNALHGRQTIEFRIGIHLGDIVVEDDDIFGDGVNVAARLEGLAERLQHQRLMDQREGEGLGLPAGRRAVSGIQRGDWRGRVPPLNPGGVQVGYAKNPASPRLLLMPYPPYLPYPLS